MEVTDKIIKQVLETKYLSVENSSRYRVILRFFFLNYEKLKYWLYQEDVFEELKSHEYFRDYTLELCQQDLAQLKDWGNLVTIQDTRKVASIEEFKNKKFRYQMTEYSVQIERLIIKLENLFIEGASLEPTLLERIRHHIEKLEEVSMYSDNEKIYAWWNDLNNDFIRLNQNYQDYIRELNSVKAEEMMKTSEFLVFKDKLTEYLRSFVKNLQKNAGIIEELLRAIDRKTIASIMEKVIIYELSIPRIDTEVNEEMLRDRLKGRWTSLDEWFVGTPEKGNEAEKLLDSTNEIIRRITRYAAQISEFGNSGANRKEEYAKVASVFMKCVDINEAHRLSAMVFGIDKSVHLKGEFNRQTDSMNSSSYDEEPKTIMISPRTRMYREKSQRTPIQDKTGEKAELIRKMQEEEKELKERLDSMVQDNRIIFSSLPVLEQRVREELLKWISNGLEDKEHSGRTEDGRRYRIELDPGKEKILLRCTDGNFLMPYMELVFE